MDKKALTCAPSHFSWEFMYVIQNLYLRFYVCLSVLLNLYSPISVRFVYLPKLVYTIFSALVCAPNLVCVHVLAPTSVYQMFYIYKLGWLKF